MRHKLINEDDKLKMNEKKLTSLFRVFRNYEKDYYNYIHNRQNALENLKIYSM